jgi:hypothetical protein
MSSLKQIAANRRNALKSIGPTTSEGKRRSRCNAVRHGLTAETVIVGVEDPHDYEAFEAAVISDYDARSAVERELVLRLASVLWRLRRATGIETALFESAIKQSYEFQRETFSRATADLLLSQLFLENKEEPKGNSSDNAIPKKQIADGFLRLTAVPPCPMSRVSRYEHILWRQARQIVFTLKALSHRKMPSNRAGPSFSLRRDNRFF